MAAARLLHSDPKTVSNQALSAGLHVEPVGTHSEPTVIPSNIVTPARIFYYISQMCTCRNLLEPSLDPIMILSRTATPAAISYYI